ncbi:acyl-homoserine-lactone acylase [Actinomadura pelletieri DSM 43383]|uniref:Acyl-homoserine-lactone acylase n=1 Tax=Actinomadura pelletieri DSM 43383 TaxID=1120940 RepID=A0A495Q901_9ACTN|nr:penicillin acylase family protein [Actinomadura pelletieri]RKS67785.1 acyl-homoserine-lactone acylase [Actinomadura pelletieri DSM 43383]
MLRTPLRVAGAAVLAAALLVPATSSVAAENGRSPSVTIRYTEYGIPHITASSHRGLGYGTGYAAAKDNICLLAQGIVTLSGERSRYFGPDAAPDGSLSSASTNLASDVFFTRINDSGIVERLAAEPAPYGPAAQVRDLARGWAAGYNRYLREGEITDPACKGAPWLRPITERDVHRRMYALAMFIGSGLVADGAMSATPPGDGSQPRTQPRTQPRQEAVEAARNLIAGADMGSNAIAVGAKATANRRGLLLGNPHYPWHGGRRFWQAHQTIPGKLDVSGAALLGSPLVNIGHNATFAWSHTVATGLPFALTELRLAPGDPTSYLVDGKARKMTKDEVTVQAKQQDGSLKPVTKTLWRTHHGPVVSSVDDIELPWTTQTAYALIDPNATNLRVANTSLALGEARTTDAAVRALKRTQGLPWVNTIAADARGKALFAQIQVLPNIPDEFAGRCNTPFGRELFRTAGLAVLNGADSSCTPGKAPGAVQPGILDTDRYPVLSRGDYVTNSNDSHWLSNPDEPLTGYDRVIGSENTMRSLRTRSGLVAVRDQLAEGPFTRADMQDLIFANRSPAGELAVSGTVAMCRDMELGKACDVLAAWDRTVDSGSRGALLFDRYWRRTAAERDVWRTPFDASDPVNTPRDFNPGSPAARQALRAAVDELTSSGIPLDAPLGDHQYVTRNGERIPIGGGTEALGILNKIEARWTPGKGYVEIAHGTSYVQVVSFDGDRCPDTRTLLTYSQSADPTSPHYADQTRLFSKKTWVTERFCGREIDAAPGLKTIELRGP